MAKAKQEGGEKPLPPIYDQKLKVNGTFLDLMDTSGKAGSKYKKKQVSKAGRQRGK